MSNDKIKLGDKIKVTEKFVRIRHGIKKIWHKRSIPATQVMVVGIRTLSNGLSEYDSDYGWVYKQDETFRAMLVVEGIYKKLFYVPMMEAVK